MPRHCALISVTQGPMAMNPEDMIVYCARVSSPENQLNFGTSSRLLQYLMQHKHWSPFEMVDMTVEIETSRAISAQILRHRSFSFQEFSQRYAKVPDIRLYKARRQDEKNRQASHDDLSDSVKHWWGEAQMKHAEHSLVLYNEALERGIAKECARMLLPMSSSTKLYMKGSIRSWIHYLQVRCGPETQLEHRDIALEIRDEVFKPMFPIIHTLLEITP